MSHATHTGLTRSSMQRASDRRRWPLLPALVILCLCSFCLCSCQSIPSADPGVAMTAGSPAPQHAVSDPVAPTGEEVVQAALSETAPDSALTYSSPVDRADGSMRPARPAVPQALVAARPIRSVPCPPQPSVAPCPAPSGCGTGIACGGWTPPGLRCPWPEDEYLCDGGDQGPEVRVRSDWSLRGLDSEDTVVHYDTIDGQTHVTATNRVCIYAPRFAAVRKIYGLAQHDYLESASRLDQPTQISGMGEVESATTAIQPVQPGLNRATTGATTFRDRRLATGLDRGQAVAGARGTLLPFEDFRMIRDGQMDQSEKARLALAADSAVVWSHDTGLQVVIDNIAAHEDSGTNQAGSVHTYSTQGKPRLKVCKVASRKDARPGELVEFTIRFDNVGDQVIGNVTVVDNLTTRLEYVEGSQNCTLKAGFSSDANAGDSLVLRWEITEPVEVGEGGVIRFQCRVR